MSPTALPLISEADYPVFQRMIRELLEITYEEWRDEHRKAIAYRKPRNGSQEIPITPAGFGRWLEQNQLEAHMELLWACVEEMTETPPKQGVRQGT